MRVVKVCRWTYAAFRTLLNASLTAWSKHEPTRPMDGKTPAEALNEHLLSAQEAGVATTG